MANEYTVGWMVALPLELVASRLFLEQEHDHVPHADGDDNSYILGSIGNHNIVMAAPPRGKIGLVTAANVIGNMIRSFPNLCFVMMIGIAGGAPSRKHDIRLGDVVVSSPSGNSGGVRQYDFGDREQGRPSTEKGHLNAPPNCVLSSVTKLEVDHKINGNSLRAQVDEMLQRHIGLQGEHSRPQTDDVLYKSRFKHGNSQSRFEQKIKNSAHNSDSEYDSSDSEASEDECSAVCGQEGIKKRKDRTPDKNATVVHYGLIASGNSKIEDADFRDKYAKERNILCFEMEAAGIMDRFPCIVIRGICDYCDTHINKKWQGYAAMVAAAYARDLLRVIPAPSVERERRLVAALESMHTTMKEVRRQNETMMLSQHQTEVVEWLSAPATSVNAANARKSRQPETGQWFLDSTAFCDWKRWEPGSRKYLWLNGMPGSGKTVLVTKIIDHLDQLHRDQDYCIILRFFYDFNDNKLQKVDSMARSFSAQMYRHLCTRQQNNLATELEKLYNKLSPSGENPSAEDLIGSLSAMMGGPLKIYIVIDAMDESEERQPLVNWLGRFFTATNDLSSIKLIMTSRPETDFNRQIPDLIGKDNCMPLQKAAVNVDIGIFVDFHINNPDSTLSKWKKLPALHKRIRDELCKRADGMFRWAALQLKEIEKCLDQSDVEHALANLPKSLDETYSRTLQRIPEHQKDKATQLLQLILYSMEPITLQEAVDVVAVQIGGGIDQGFHHNRMMPEPTDIAKYYPDLVVITSKREYGTGESPGTEESFGKNKMKYIHLAHFSAKEYLRKQADFAKGKASANITRVCTAYLFSSFSHPSSYGLFRALPDFPFGEYAISNLGAHAYLAEKFSADRAFINELVSLIDYFKDGFWLKDLRFLADPLAWASEAGLCETLERLLATQRWDIKQQEASVASGKSDFTALYLASSEGHESIVELLLRGGADLYFSTDVMHRRSNPLEAAASRGNLQMVKLLIDRGADIISPRTRESLKVLESVVKTGHLDVLRYLLHQFSDKTRYGSVLNAAIMEAAGVPIPNRNPKLRPHDIVTIMQELVNAGGDIHCTGVGRYDNTLQTSSRAPNSELVRYLIANGVQVNRKGGMYCTALQAAARSGSEDIVRLLLQNGADVNIKGGKYGTALQAAAISGSEDIVRLLLQNGADVNIKGGYFGTALQAAAERGDVDMVLLFLQNGADVNIKGGEYGTALQAAAERGCEDIVRLLLQNGADVDMWVGEWLNTSEIQGIKRLLERRKHKGGFFEIVKLVIGEMAPRYFWFFVGNRQKTLFRASQRWHRRPHPRADIKKRLGLKKRLDVKTKTATPFHSRYKVLVEKHLERMANKTAVRYLRDAPCTTRQRARHRALRKRYKWSKQRYEQRQIKKKRWWRLSTRLF